jgi:hypothetical protein
MTGHQLELSALKRTWIDESAAVLDSKLLRRGVQMTAETIRQYVTEPPHPNWIGCLTAALRCKGRIKEVGRVKSNRPERNGAKITLWEAV